MVDGRGRRDLDLGLNLTSWKLWGCKRDVLILITFLNLLKYIVI